LRLIRRHIISNSLNSLEVHATACRNGFWDVNPKYSSIYRTGCALLLILDELQEAGDAALEFEYSTIFDEEGRRKVAEEWADIGLRCMDLLGALGVYPNYEADKVVVEGKNLGSGMYLPSLEARTTKTIFSLVRTLRKTGDISSEQDTSELKKLVRYILSFEDIYEAAVHKNDVNKTRPFMHGGKFF
jgi:hypothetical protein